MRLPRRSAFAAAVLVLAATGCGAGSDPASSEPEIDLTASGYLQPGTEFWDGWTVPEGTVLLGTPFPEPDRDREGTPENADPVSAEFLVTGDGYDVVRDLYAQIVERGLRPVVRERDEGVCGHGDSSYACRLFAQGEDGYTKLEARLQVSERPEEAEPYPRLEVRLGESSQLDIVPDFSEQPIYEGMTEEEIQEREDELRTQWVDAEPPEGDAPASTPAAGASGLAPGSDLPFYGRDEPLGTVPEGSRLLAPPYSPSLTYGFAGIFYVEDDAAIAALEDMAAEAATGERYPDGELVSGDLVSHRIAYDGSGGGCAVKLDVVDQGSGNRIARLDIACD